MSTTVQRTFAGGELTPALYSRVDTVKYATGLRTLRNMTVRKSGGARNRAGSVFVGQIKKKGERVRLIPFVLSQEESYVLEFSSGSTFRVIRDGQYLKYSDVDVAANTFPPKNVNGISNANPGLVVANGHGYENGDEVIFEDLGGMTQLNGRLFIVRNKTANTFTLEDTLYGTAIDTSAYSAFTAGGTVDRIFSTAISFSPDITYGEANLPYTKYSQNSEELVLVNKAKVGITVQLSTASDPNFQLGILNIGTPDVAPVTDLQNDGGAGTTTFWKVTAIGVDGEESLSVSGSFTSSAATPASGTPVNLLWTDIPNAYAYKIYRSEPVSGNLLFITTVPYGSKYKDIGAVGTPAERIDGIGSEYAAAVTHFQQRRILGGNFDPALARPDTETIFGSWIAHYNDFFVPQTQTDASPISFSLAGQRVAEIEHFVALGKLFALTKSTELIVDGNQDGVVSPVSGINVRPLAYNGSWHVAPVTIDDNFLYIQARGSVIRDFGAQIQADFYKGNDLTIFANHLFEGYTIVDWSYQQTPDSIVWVVRSDGALLSITYVAEQQIFAWAHHDLGEGAFVENVCVIPELDGDSVYFCVRRTIDGVETRYIERMKHFVILTQDDVVDCVYMDSALKYDGRNTNVMHTMTVPSAVNVGDTVAMTSSLPIFTADDLGNEIHATDPITSVKYRFEIMQYLNVNQVLVSPKNADLTDATVFVDWSRAVDTVSGLGHIEGKQVSVLGDGYVVASPNNPAYPVVTVTDGAIQLDACYSVITAGLPYVSDLETLDIDTANGETIVDKKKLVTGVTIYVEKTRGLWAGQNPGDDTISTLEESKVRNEETYDDPNLLASGEIQMNIMPEWNSNGRILVRQADPLPMSILGIAPAGLFPFKGGG